MLKLTLDAIESFNEETQEFVEQPALELKLEHSLFSMSKWESSHEKPFLKSDKSYEETVDYILCMAPEDAPEDLIHRLTNAHVSQVNDYIKSNQTATWFAETNGKKSPTGEIVTSEVIYYWMIALNIPFECQHWHLNRLLTLIRVCNEKNQQQSGDKKGKMTPAQLAARNRELNAQRRKQYNTKG